jgi:cobalt/nickel transport system permease protein
MKTFNASIVLLSAFIYSVFISFQTFEVIFLIPITYMLWMRYTFIWEVLKKLLFLNLFIVMIFVVLALQNNLEDAINIYVRTNMIILFNLLLFVSSNGFDIVRALNELRFPKRFVSTTYFGLKMIQTLSQEFKKIKQTLRARGFHARSSLFTYETYGNVFGHIFVKSIRKAITLQESFILRGFHGRVYLNNSSSVAVHDIILMFCVIVIIMKEWVVG